MKRRNLAQSTQVGKEEAQNKASDAAFEHELATDDICTHHTRIHTLGVERSLDTLIHNRWIKMVDDDDDSDNGGY